MHAIPFHSSVRIKLGAGQQIVDADKNPIGINVTAKTIKNKVSAPFRSVDFEIHFGKGIVEHEQMFDRLRKFGPTTVDGYQIEVSGNGAWKNLIVFSPEGEMIIEKKFYKSEFGQIMKDPQYRQYVDMLIDAALVKKSVTEEDIDIDPESYEEVKAIAEGLTDLDSDAYEDLS
jgi:hypothetical protein